MTVSATGFILWHVVTSRDDAVTSIREVARRANVSPATVSRAFSEPGLVRQETLARVLAVAEELRYRPSRAARSLTTGKTGNIGVIVPDLGNPFFPAILKGAQARAREADHAVFLADSEENPRLEIELVRAMARQVDGVLICSSRLSEADLQQLLRDTTLVLLNRRVGGASSVQMDAVGGMRQAVEHLVALGHRRVAYVSGPRQSWSNRERRRGLRTSSRAKGLEVVEFGPFAPHFEAGQQAADLAVAAEVTAVIAFNDLMALGVLSRLADRGIGVPEQISVVGFDDIPMASMATPHLTTVAVPLEQAGRVAIELLLEQLASPGSGTHEQGLASQLIVRASTAPPQSDARTGSYTARGRESRKATAITES
ncbi:MAG TPA: LacI family DNA-binding transcriptional regulator [Candidatus Limnocylindrales bacterium]